MLPLLSLAHDARLASCREREQVFFDVSIGGEPAGRITIGLLTSKCEDNKNFVELCKGSMGFGYAKGRFHKVIPNFMLQEATS